MTENEQLCKEHKTHKVDWIYLRLVFKKWVSANSLKKLGSVSILCHFQPVRLPLQRWQHGLRCFGRPTCWGIARFDSQSVQMGANSGHLLNGYVGYVPSLSFTYHTYICHGRLPWASTALKSLHSPNPFGMLFNVPLKSFNCSGLARPVTNIRHNYAMRPGFQPIPSFTSFAKRWENHKRMGERINPLPTCWLCKPLKPRPWQIDQQTIWLVLHPFHRQETPVNWHSGPNKHKNAVDINMAFRQNIVLYSLMLFIILLLQPSFPLKLLCLALRLCNMAKETTTSGVCMPEQHCGL